MKLISGFWYIQGVIEKKNQKQILVILHRGSRVRIHYWVVVNVAKHCHQETWRNQRGDEKEKPRVKYLIA